MFSSFLLLKGARFTNWRFTHCALDLSEFSCNFHVTLLKVSSFFGWLIIYTHFSYLCFQISHNIFISMQGYIRSEFWIILQVPKEQFIIPTLFRIHLVSLFLNFLYLLFAHSLNTFLFLVFFIFIWFDFFIFERLFFY